MKKINFIDSIRNPIITEKATILSNKIRQFLKFTKMLTKNNKKNIEKLFKVNVIKLIFSIRKLK